MVMCLQRLVLMFSGTLSAKKGFKYILAMFFTLKTGKPFELRRSVGTWNHSDLFKF